MANSLSSNITNKVMRKFMAAFESSKVLCKTVNTQIIDNAFTPEFGDTIRIKRPHQYKAKRTTDGDITGQNANAITSGTAVATVQDYITVDIEWTNREEALFLDQKEDIISPAAEEAVTELETSFGQFMQSNAALHRGTVGSPIAEWGDVAGCNSLMQSIGVPMSGPRYAVMNPFAIQNLADTQSGLASGDNSLVNMAWEQAKISRNFGGLQGLTSNALPSITLGADAGASGTVSGTPDGTYLAAKDSMQQTITITGLTASVVDAIRPGDTIQVTAPDRNRLNVMTRQVAFGAGGAPLAWFYKVVSGGDTDGSGAVTLTVTSAAINEADGQYNNISNPIVDGDAVTVLGTADQVVQPGLFYHKDAFALATVRLPKLHTWDTVAESNNGFSIRCTKYSDGDGNSQKIRFDLLPAFSCMNPNFAGTFYGTTP